MRWFDFSYNVVTDVCHTIQEKNNPSSLFSDNTLIFLNRSLTAGDALIMFMMGFIANIVRPQSHRPRDWSAANLWSLGKNMCSQNRSPARIHNYLKQYQTIIDSKVCQGQNNKSNSAKVQEEVLTKPFFHPSCFSAFYKNTIYPTRFLSGKYTQKWAKAWRPRIGPINAAAAADSSCQGINCWRWGPISSCRGQPKWLS